MLLRPILGLRTRNCGNQTSIPTSSGLPTLQQKLLRCYYNHYFWSKSNFQWRIYHIKIYKEFHSRLFAHQNPLIEPLLSSNLPENPFITNSLFYNNKIPITVVATYDLFGENSHEAEEANHTRQQLNIRSSLPLKTKWTSLTVTEWPRTDSLKKKKNHPNIRTNELNLRDLTSAAVLPKKTHFIQSKIFQKKLPKHLILHQLITLQLNTLNALR